MTPVPPESRAARHASKHWQWTAGLTGPVCSAWPYAPAVPGGARKRWRPPQPQAPARSRHGLGSASCRILRSAAACIPQMGRVAGRRPGRTWAMAEGRLDSPQPAKRRCTRPADSTPDGSGALLASTTMPRDHGGA